MAKGHLYLIPNTLTSPTQATFEAYSHALAASLPLEVMQILTQCACLVVETPKVARQFVKAVLVATESTRVVQDIPMRELGTKTPDGQVADMLAPCLAGQHVGLLSDAGCPAIADPGAKLVAAAHAAGVRVIPLVGPSSIVLALMASGLSGQNFAFHGYLPVDAAERGQTLRRLEQASRSAEQTQLFIETPYRNSAMLDALLAQLAPQTRLCVAIDLTLASEYVRTLTITQWRALQKAGELPDCHKRPALFLFLA